MTFRFMQVQRDNLIVEINQALAAFDQSRSQEGVFTAAYQAVFDAISKAEYVSVPRYSDVVVILPADGVPANVWAWVAGAEGVNQASGGFAGFIRDYTFYQRYLSTGYQLNEDGDCAEFCALAPFVTPWESGLRT